jgi:hypothetical protein
MLTSANIGKQNGDTRTRKTEPGYLKSQDIPLCVSYVPMTQSRTQSQRWLWVRDCLCPRSIKDPQEKLSSFL